MHTLELLGNPIADEVIQLIDAQLMSQVSFRDESTRSDDKMRDRTGSTVAELRAEGERMLRDAMFLERLPQEDVFEDGTVLSFTWHAGNVDYRYAAMRSGGEWYLTGKVSGGSMFNWGGLIEYLRVRSIREIWVMRRDYELSDWNKPKEMDAQTAVDVLEARKLKNQGADGDATQRVAVDTPRERAEDGE
jgi:hypothetical protein